MCKRQLHEVGELRLCGGVGFPITMEKDKSYRDTAIRIEGVVYELHRCVLACASAYFHTLFTSSITANILEHNIPDITVDIFLLVLSWAYHGECTLQSNEQLVPLLYAANMLQMDLLQSTVGHAIANNITEDSVFGAWDLADKFDMHDILLPSILKLCTHCWSKIMNDKNKLIFITFKRLCALLGQDGICANEYDLLEVIDNWLSECAGTNDFSDEMIAQLVSNVRFNSMSEDQINSFTKKRWADNAFVLKSALLSSKDNTKRPRYRGPRYGVNDLLEKPDPTTFLWTIRNFSGLYERKKTSSLPFQWLEWNWAITLYPQGNQTSSYMSVYLECLNTDRLERGDMINLAYEIKLLSPNQGENKSHEKRFSAKFCSKTKDWGSREFVCLNELDKYKCPVDSVVLVIHFFQADESS